MKYRCEDSDVPNNKTEILVVSRVGEMGLWYKVSFISFIGTLIIKI